jgi:hypothetical protein
MLCKPTLICEHNIRKTTCMKCNPNLRCQHDTRKSLCMVCNPRLKCEHGIGKYGCMVCNPQLSCKHGRHKRTCTECNPNKKCETHKMVMCLKCNPSLACPEHPTQRKSRCSVCGGPGICGHGKQKESCSQCRYDGNPGISFCKETKILKRDCPCKICSYNRVVRGGIIKKYTRRAPPQPQAPKAQGGVVYEEQLQPRQEAVVQGVAQEGEDHWLDDDYDVDVFKNESDDDGWETDESEMEGGKRKRKRKQRFTRRLRRRNHNTKKSKIVKRKITKHSRKIKYKLK